jgi:hypothetical protein
MKYNGNEDSNPPSVESKDKLIEINPIDYDEVFTRAEDSWWDFDYTSKKEVDEHVLMPGKFSSDHPTHANQYFMSGRWVARL